MHWGPVVHATPLALRAQLFVVPVPWQVFGDTQSVSAVHVVLHALVPQTKGVHGVVVAGAHAPGAVPVQCERFVSVLPEHVTIPHETPAPATAQAPAPLHRPVLPQGGFAGQPPRGSALPDATFAQAPALPVTAHDWQSGQVEVAQQTPSTQKLPVRQSAVVLQDWPARFLFPHSWVFWSQMLGARQSASVAQAALHAVDPLHRYGAQEIAAAAGLQLPTPSQVRAGVTDDARLGHDGATHCVPPAYRRQAPLPSQKPSCLQTATPWSLQPPCGSVAPFATLLQVPSVAVRSHVWQVPVQGELQHTPCAQNPDWHSAPVAHALPSVLSPHEPFVHTAGEAQSPSVVQVFLQTPVPHRNGKHELVAGVTQAPAPSQVDVAVNWVVVAGQVDGLQLVPLTYF
jgi:hypothetical protein